MKQVNRDTIIRILIVLAVDLAIFFFGRLERGYYAIGAELPATLLGVYWVLQMREYYFKHDRKDA